MALQNSSIDSMNTFLSKTYHIPNYQREYSWEENELNDFWDDLESTKEEDNGLKHFFGQIVVHNDEDERKRYIIDGQQRTITSTIFLRAMQYLYQKLYDQSGIREADYKRSDIESIHIGRQNKYHLTLGDLDNEYFEKNIQLGIPNETKKEKKKSHERIRKAFWFFENRLRKALSEYIDDNDKVDCLNDYYDAFVERFNILYMEATRLEEAFIIFETLNARGRELETADLLKNYIFSQSRDINLAQTKWNAMLNKLDKVDPTKYIRHFWNSCNDFTREKALYRTINKNISNPRAGKNLLDKLERNAQCYHDIVNPDDNVGFEDERLIRSLKAIKTLKASSFYPVILAMKQSDQNFSESDIRAVVESIEVYVFRNFTICGHVANKAEIFFADLAKGIYDGTYETTSEICDIIKQGIVTDKEFSDAFELWSGTKSGKETVRYILRKMHQYLDRANEINLNTSEVHIEHIMPEDNSQWQVPEDEHEAYLWRLGNLALISGKFNISMSNKPFEQKKARYVESKIEPNKDIALNIDWNGQAIEERQKRLLGYALKIWKKNH